MVRLQPPDASASAGGLLKQPDEQEAAGHTMITSAPCRIWMDRSVANYRLASSFTFRDRSVVTFSWPRQHSARPMVSGSNQDVLRNNIRRPTLRKNSILPRRSDGSRRALRGSLLTGASRTILRQWLN